ncbi:MAG TPA: hypothetical protein VF627_06185 [Abditibacterium sp.]|jgi:hypothetical protein
MKRVFPLILCGVLAASAHAQPLVVAPSTPAQEAQKRAEIVARREASKASKTVAPGSGFYFLLLAAEMTNDAFDLPVAWPDEETPEQIEAYEREDAARRVKQAKFLELHGAEALHLLRIALEKGIERPVIDGQPFDYDAGDHNYRRYFGQLGQALMQESATRLAAGDAKGALESRLDCVELGVVTSDGSFSDLMMGASGQGGGRQKLGPIVALLDAASCRTAAARLAKIEAKRAPFAVNVAVMSGFYFLRALKMLNDENVRKALASPERRFQFGYEDKGISEADARRVLALTPETLRQSIDRYYAAIANTTLPFPQAQALRVPADLKFLDILDVPVLILKEPAQRFIYEQSVLENRLLIAALELRAIKLETGAYPSQFDAPIDPFSFPSQRLIYKLNDGKPQLYSVGPDGVDNGAAPPQTPWTDEETGKTTVRRGLSAEATGDISATLF